MNYGTTAGLYEKSIIVSVTLPNIGVQRLPTLPGCRRLTFLPHKAPRVVNVGRVWIMVRNRILNLSTGKLESPAGGDDPISGGAALPLDPYALIGTVPAFPYSLQWLSPESASANFDLADFWIETTEAGDGVEVFVNY